MGMYTEFHFNSDLKKDVPEDVIDVLKFMVGDLKRPPRVPDHALFNSDDWKIMLRMDSYYFDADTTSTLRFDDNASKYYLCIRCNLKNYNRQIQMFVNWIRQYCNKDGGEFLGFFRYEETETPTLIYA